jgi:hypothetical protein
MRTDRREALIGRLILISHCRGAIATGILSGIAEASSSAAVAAPAPANCVPSKGNGSERQELSRTVLSR